MKNFLIPVLLVDIACSSDPVEMIDDTPETPAASSVQAKDVSNFGDARDIQISFNKPGNISLIEEFRIFVIPEPIAVSFDSLAAITQMEYLSVNKLGQTSKINFDENHKDIEGNPIVESKRYIFSVWSQPLTTYCGGHHTYIHVVGAVTFWGKVGKKRPNGTRRGDH